MTTPRLGAPELTSGQALPETTVNEQIRYLESGAGHFIFKDRDLATPPGSPADGDCYLVAASPTGAWAGQAGKIAFYLNTAWKFIAAIEGFTAWVNDENAFIGYDGAAWNVLSSPSGTYQPLDSDLTAIAALTTTTFGRALLALADAAALRTSAGLGTIATEDEATAAQIRAGTASKAVAADKLITAVAPQTLTDGATVSWDMSTATNAKVTIAGNRTLTVSNPVAGMTYSLGVNQDATGSRTMTWPSSFDWGTTGAPTLTTTASKRDRVTVFCTDAATPKFDAFLSGKGFS